VLVTIKGKQRGTVLAVFILVSLWGAQAVYGRVTRSDALRAYVVKLDGAEAPYLRHFGVGDQAVADLIHRFAQSSATSADVLAVTDGWTKDFDSSSSAVRALAPPRELRDANEMIAAGIEGFGDCARLLTVAAQQRALKATIPDEMIKQKIENEVQLQLTHLDALRRHAEALVQAGRAHVDTLRAAWGVAAPSPSASAS